jgi:hypothetical protein
MTSRAAKPARRPGAARKPSSATATYVYALARGAQPRALAGSPPGVPGAGPARAVAVAPGLWLVLADVPLRDYRAPVVERGLRDLEWVSTRALAHAAVVERLLGQEAVLPMKLFTLFADEASARRSIRRRRRRLEPLLDRVAGATEWGVRVRLDAAAPRATAPRATARRAAGDGRGFLLRKKAERDAGREARTRAAALAGETYEGLAGGAAAARRNPVPAGAPVLLDAAFLVRRREERRFERQVDRWARRLAAAGCEVTLSGPWPPYHFAGVAGGRVER